MRFIRLPPKSYHFNHFQASFHASYIHTTSRQLFSSCLNKAEAVPQASLAKFFLKSKGYKKHTYPRSTSLESQDLPNSSTLKNMAIKEFRNIYYTQGSTDQAHTLDLYVPTHDPVHEQPPNLAVFVHGGWWRANYKDDYVAFGRGLAQINHGIKSASYAVAVAVISYRLAVKGSDKVKHPDQLIDTINAIEFLSKYGAKYGYSAKNIALIGTSCGGHILGLIALDPPATWWETCKDGSSLPLAKSIKHIVSIAGAYDLNWLAERYPEYQEFFTMNFGTDKDYWQATNPQNAPFNLTHKQKVQGTFPEGFQPHGDPLTHVKYLVLLSTSDELFTSQTCDLYATHLKEIGIDTTVCSESDFGSHSEQLKNPELFKYVYSFIYQ